MARPRAFDEQAVLEAAGQAFWSRGYEATSTRDLVKATGLAQPSLYNAFGDKRGLFNRALEHYLDYCMRERIARLEASLPPHLAITMFLYEMIERSLEDPQNRGCMLVNSTLEVTHDNLEVRDMVVDCFDLIRAFFARCLNGAQQLDAISLPVPAADAATHLLAVLLGLRVIARIGPERAMLNATVSPALTLLGLPPLPPLEEGVRPSNRG